MWSACAYRHISFGRTALRPKKSETGPTHECLAVLLSLWVWAIQSIGQTDQMHRRARGLWAHITGKCTTNEQTIVHIDLPRLTILSFIVSCINYSLAAWISRKWNSSPFVVLKQEGTHRERESTNYYLLIHRCAAVNCAFRARALFTLPIESRPTPQTRRKSEQHSIILLLAMAIQSSWRMGAGSAATNIFIFICPYCG